MPFEEKILIISNNALSLSKNNGKTLESFFCDYPSECLAQLYFSDETPVSNCCQNFFNISEKKIIYKILGKTSVPLSEEETEHNSTQNVMGSKRKTEFMRVLREILWRKKLWKTDEFVNWIDRVDPNIVFFCGGDSGFAYNITKYVVKRTNAKLVLFLTDDYIINSPNKNIWFKLRTFNIKKKMRDCINAASLFITISEKMSNAYERLFGKKSKVFMNMADDIESEYKEKFNDSVLFTYLGGFSYGRGEVLLKLGNAIERYNKENDDRNKAILEIYSNSMDNVELIEKFNKHDAIYFGGQLSPLQVKEKLKMSDVLVHVESFDRQYIAKTYFSISTKIPEYLSSKRLICAIGPAEVASMEYLDKHAFCIKDINEIAEGIFHIITDDFSENKKIIESAYKLYQKAHNPQTTRIEFQKCLRGLLTGR